MGQTPDLKAGAEIGRRELVGSELVHVASLLLLNFSVKVVHHKNRISFCGGLLKRNRGAFLPKVRPVGVRCAHLSKTAQVGPASSAEYPISQRCNISRQSKKGHAASAVATRPCQTQGRARSVLVMPAKSKGWAPRLRGAVHPSVPDFSWRELGGGSLPRPRTRRITHQF